MKSILSIVVFAFVVSIQVNGQCALPSQEQAKQFMQHTVAVELLEVPDAERAGYLEKGAEGEKELAALDKYNHWYNSNVQLAFEEVFGTRKKVFGLDAKGIENSILNGENETIVISFGNRKNHWIEDGKVMENNMWTYTVFIPKQVQKWDHSTLTRPTTVDRKHVIRHGNYMAVLGLPAKPYDVTQLKWVAQYFLNHFSKAQSIGTPGKQGNIEMHFPELTNSEQEALEKNSLMLHPNLTKLSEEKIEAIYTKPFRLLDQETVNEEFGTGNEGMLFVQVFWSQKHNRFAVGLIESSSGAFVAVVPLEKEVVENYQKQKIVYDSVEKAYSKYLESFMLDEGNLRRLAAIK